MLGWFKKKAMMFAFFAVFLYIGVKDKKPYEGNNKKNN